MIKLRDFLMWCSILNGGCLIITALIFGFFCDWIYSMHTRWYALSRESFNNTIYAFFVFYKMLFILFCLFPYIALVIIT
jgi:hypothetical protein